MLAVNSFSLPNPQFLFFVESVFRLFTSLLIRTKPPRKNRQDKTSGYAASKRFAGFIFHLDILRLS